jgi:hypothetical protein
VTRKCSASGAALAVEVIKANETDATSAPTTNSLRMFVTPFSPLGGAIVSRAATQVNKAEARGVVAAHCEK